MHTWPGWPPLCSQHLPGGAVSPTASLATEDNLAEGPSAAGPAAAGGEMARPASVFGDKSHSFHCLLAGSHHEGGICQNT